MDIHQPAIWNVHTQDDKKSGIPQGGSISLTFCNIFQQFSIIFRLARNLFHSSLCKVVLIRLFRYKSSALPAIIHRSVYSNKRTSDSINPGEPLLVLWHYIRIYYPKAKWARRYIYIGDSVYCTLSLWTRVSFVNLQLTISLVTRCISLQQWITRKT